MSAPVRLGIHGASGRLGQALLQAPVADPGWQLVAAWVRADSPIKGKETGVPGVSYVSLADWLASDQEKPQVVVDFSSPAAVVPLARNMAMLGVPLVSGTTGLSEKEFAALEKASQAIPVLWAPNFSLSVLLWQEFLQRLARVHDGSWQARIEETHHAGKQDAPSGTAIALARSLLPKLPMSAVQPVAVTDTEFVLGSVPVRSIRHGNVAGIHEITFASPGETLIMRHEAKSPAVFAQGALQAAKWLYRQPPGYYQLEKLMEAIVPLGE